MTNSVIDLIIRIKNGYLAKRETVVSPYSKFREAVLKKLVELKYVGNYKVRDELKKEIIIELLYHDNKPALSEVKIFSKPGKRHYLPYHQLKPVLSGYGVSLLSTSKGILTNREAYRTKIGGELLFNIW